jgi:chitinase
MIGHNDLKGEVTELATARGLNEFAREHGIGRLSMWSLNRDRPCGKDVDQPSNTCSGVDQAAGEFSSILGDGYTGRIR